jgi:excisionase family DNA binding protein
VKKPVLKQAIAPASLEPRLLDLKSAAAYLSATIWFMRTCVWENRIPYLRCGHSILFDKKDLDAFVESQKQAARA